MRPCPRLAPVAALLVAFGPGRALAQVDPYELEPAPEAASVEPPAPPPPPPSPPAPAASAAPGPELLRSRGEPGAPDSSVQKVRVRYQLEGIEIRGNARTASRVVLRYVKFRAGDVLDVDDPEIELTRYRLLGTGFFKTVQLSLRKGTRRGSAVLVVELEERNTFVVQNLWIGIAADEDTAGNVEPLSAYVGVQAAETNLAGTGITLGAGVGVAADQLALRTRFVDPAFVGTGWSVSGSFLYNDARDFFGARSVAFESPALEDTEVRDYAVVAYKRIGGAVGAGRDISVASQFQLEYRLEKVEAVVPTMASHIRGETREPIDFDILPGDSILSTLGASYYYDSRDAPFLTKKGTLARASLTVGLPPVGSDYGFQRVEIAAQHWIRLPWKHVIRLEAFGGGIAGDAPFFEKFYVGDFTALLPDRLLDLAPDRRQPPNFLDTDIIEVRYGDFAGKLEAEYRIPLYSGRGAVYGVDVFAAGGLYGVATRRELDDPPSGYEGFQKVPIDITYNLGLRVDTSLGGVTLAFSNLLGLIPARSGQRK